MRAWDRPALQGWLYVAVIEPFTIPRPLACRRPMIVNNPRNSRKRSYLTRRVHPAGTKIVRSERVIKI